MNKFNKKTLTLILASIVSVMSAFGAEQYKNSLMSLSFENGSNGTVNFILHTKNQYSGNITPSKKDANTYVLILPETNSLTPTPDINAINNLESVNIKTMPYSEGGKGYTRIVLKTSAPTQFLGHNKIFNASSASHANNYTNNQQKSEQTNSVQSSAKSQPQYNDTDEDMDDLKKENKQTVQTPKQNIENTSTTSATENNLTNSFTQKQNVVPTKKDNDEAFFLVLGVLFVSIVLALLYSRGKEKVKETIGEDFVIDLNETKNTQPKKKGAFNNIKHKINTLDEQYSQVIITKKDLKKYETSLPAVSDEAIEASSVINLDALFEQQNNENNDSEDDLDDFLQQYYQESNRSEENDEELTSESAELYNEELFNQIINDTDIQFDNNDISKIKSLINIEITEDMMHEIKHNFQTKPQNITSVKRIALESMVLTYSLERDVRFDSEDINTLRKLMAVEIDTDFVTDLRTDAKKTQQMEQDIINYNGEEARKKNSVKKLLNGYEVEVLNIKDELPDLQDALRNPNKYDKHEEKPIVVDEQTMLKNIENVVFKPFYDGTNTFEIINKPEDYDDNQTETTGNNIIDLSHINTDIKEQVKAEKTEKPVSDIEPSAQITKEKQAEQPITIEKEIKQKPAVQTTKEKQAEQPIAIEKEIKQQQIESKPVKSIVNTKNTDKVLTIKKTNNINPEPNKKAESIKKEPVKFYRELNGISYKIISTTELSPNIGCYLAKYDKGFAILGYVLDELVKIRDINDVTETTVLQSRLKEEINETTSQYILRAGKNKFVLNVNDCKFEYVMDL